MRVQLQKRAESVRPFAKNLQWIPMASAFFVLTKEYLDLILTGRFLLEIRCRRYRPGPAYSGTSSPPLVYAKVVTGEPFQITTLRQWRELEKQPMACDFKGRNRLPYKKQRQRPRTRYP
jgi:hypothetical protein